jgi:thiosulfate dehydrogenase
MGKFILGIIVGVILVFVAVYVYFATGMAPVATSAQAMPFEKRMANMALHKRAEKEAPKSSGLPNPADADYAAAADLYREHCAVCHGVPQQPQTAIAKGMFPKPPQLFKGHGVTDDPAGETYWKVANGIRLTGMPAFKDSLTDQQLWQVSVLLANADKLPDSVKQTLSSAPVTQLNTKLAPK